jgi:exodeoxyribonuclease-5
VAITRAEKRLFWVTRARLAKPEAPLQVADLKAMEAAPLALEIQDQTLL